MREQKSITNEHHSSVSERQSKYRFGNYDLVRRIDIGGMGEVYLAHQRTVFDREVAIKIIRSDLVHDATARKRFLREAEVNAHLKHEHILPLYEFGEEQGRLFLVTPYISGGTLSRRLQAGPLSLSEVYQLFTALVRAVAYVHRRGVVHRDLKPSNILLDQEENTGQIYVRLIDFGIASIQGAAASPPLTTDGTSMATIAYMAPERLLGVAAPSNDIYSLGVILYQMLTGQLPLPERRVTLPEPLEYVVNRCMAPLDDGRFATADDVLHAFEYAYQHLNASPAQKKGSSTPASIPVPDAIDNDVTPRRVTSSHPAGNLNQEVKILRRTDNVPPSPLRPPQPDGFKANDYESPTINVDNSNELAGAAADLAPSAIPGKPSPPPKSRKNPLFAFISFLIALILLAMAGLFFFEFQSAVILTSASVNFGPQAHTISQVFPINGSLSASNIDVNSATIPVKTLNDSKTGSQNGNTTQQCILPGFGCQYIVTQDDTDRISTQLKRRLDNQITQDVKNQLQSLGAVQVGSINLSITSATSDPTIGAESKTVTVSITEEGQVAYILKHDAQQLARLLLNQQVQKLGPNYILISSLTQIGEPVVGDVNSDSGLVSIKIAAGGVAQYHFPPAQLNAIRNALKSKKLKDAISFIKRQQGIDANTVAIHLSAGDTLPADIARISIIPINPTKLPPVQLPGA